MASGTEALLPFYCGPIHPNVGALIPCAFPVIDIQILQELSCTRRGIQVQAGRCCQD
jgi:hypothetical protein